MTRLSDRAFQTLKTEVDRYYTPPSEKPLSQQQNLERIILLARLEALHEQGGQGVTQAQLWEEICDIVPNFDRQVLRQASRVDLSTALSDASLGLGIASIGTAAALLANPLSPAEMIGGSSTQATNRQETAEAQTAFSQQKNLYETAKAFGWQAALKGQNPPHTARHWGETASLWEQAIALLNQIPRHDSHYEIAQSKKAEYQKNLEYIQSRHIEAQNADTLTPKPQFSRRTAQSYPAQTSRSAVAQSPSVAAVISDAPISQSETAVPGQKQKSEVAQEDALALARQYGWQAAIAAQNAPHPAEKWADISRLWQLALQHLDKIDTQHSNYPEAQQVKATYEQNLLAIRTRYQQEQDAAQRLQSLQASLTELNYSSPASSPARRSQMQAIVQRLQTIPKGTVSHRKAQQLIVSTNKQISTLPSSAAPTNGKEAAIAISQ